MTGDTSMLLNQETCIQQLLRSAGLICHGPMTLKKIKLLRKRHSTDITLTVLCARNSVMVPITAGSPQPSQCKPTSPSRSSSDSSSNISVPSLRMYVGMNGPMISYSDLDTLLHSLVENGGSLEDVTILLHKGKELHIILKAPSPTS